MFASTGFEVLGIILYNWVAFCDNFYAENDKCHGEPTTNWVANVALFNDICLALGNVFYYNGHFLFAYRYFEVAEMFGREDKSQAKHEINRGVTRKISYVCVAIISINFLIELANYGIYRRITGEYSHTLEYWTYFIIPSVFMLSYCILLLVALLWVLYSLKHDKHLIGNEKWMGLHFILLTLVLGSYIWVFFFTNNSTAHKIYNVIDCIVYLLMAFIMDQVNGPQYTVWANRKFVGRNKEEVAEHILHDRSTIINDEEPEPNDNLVDSVEPEITPLEVDNSIFEELL
jgi:hypothetical protein